MTGWALEAVCLHLEAVFRGVRYGVSDDAINRLLMNVPPGFMKSLATDVFFPAWVWGPQEWPSARFMAFSYSSGLTERDNQRFAAIVSSRRYQELWGHIVTLPTHALGVYKVANKQTGWKIASSVGGMGTGERADFVICFPYTELIATEDGPRQIGELVESRERVRAWSLNQATGLLELQPVIGWHTNPGRALVKVTTDDGASVTCTEDHKILTPNGYVPASLLVTGDNLFAAPSGVLLPSASVIGSQIKVEMCPDATITDAADSLRANAKFSGQGQGSVIMSECNRAHHFFCQMGSAVFERAMHFAIGNILRARSVFKVVQSRICSVAVFVANLLSDWAWSYEGLRGHLMAEPEIGFSIQSQGNSRIPFIENWGHDAARDIHGRSTADDCSSQTPNASISGNPVVGLKANDRTPNLVRVISVESLQDVPPATYCVTVSGNHNMLCGDMANIVCSNCDDPHNVKESESDKIRMETVRWFRESITSRMNDPLTSAIIVIMQRVNEGDVSGVILEEMDDYTQLCITMEFDWLRPPTTIGWEDPRSEIGELAFPDRFPREAVDRDKRAMGPNAVASQFQQSPAPRGGGIIKRDWWQLWDGTAFPPFDYIIASLDTAYTEKTENDYSAMVVLGVFYGDTVAHAGRILGADGRPQYIDRSYSEGAPKVMLMAAWQERLELHDLVNKVADTAKKLKVDKLLVENKAAGHSVAQEIRRLYNHETFATQLDDPKRQDKTARLYSIQAIFSSGMVYAPDRQWVEMVINQVATFPKAKHDDLTDALTAGVRHLRDLGLLAMKEERIAEIEQMKQYTGKGPAPLYPV